MLLTRAASLEFRLESLQAEFIRLLCPNVLIQGGVFTAMSEMIPVSVGHSFDQRKEAVFQL